jgi:hypothetical protein
MNFHPVGGLAEMPQIQSKAHLRPVSILTVMN